MARSRNLKPAFFTNEYLAELPPLARLLYQGLWCIADREGRLEDRPKKIKAELLPYDNCDTDKLLNTLAESPEQFIIRYEVEGKNYIAIPTFLKHQNPHVNEAPSIIPAPTESSKVPYKYYTNTILVPEQSNRDEVIGNRDEVIGNRESAGQVSEPIPYKLIVDYLNQKANTNYKHTSSKTQDLIKARINEKFTVEDFYTVIDKKVAEWMGTEWQKFLRPETLFSNKFEGYLNQKVVSNKTDRFAAMKEWLAEKEGGEAQDNETF